MVRGEIWLVNLPFTGNSIQGGGIRPMIIASNTMACKYSPVIHAIPTTGQAKKRMPTHVQIPISCGLIRTSTALCEQVMLLPKDAFIKKVGYCNDYVMDKIDRSILIQFGLVTKETVNNFAYA